ncbi:DNA repair protein rad18 [Tremella mesenterica]|uniref:Postreplication repair E3 ubiquitin-protein ligase RAD18 n=1 Tax=Tremella mesenterica TaxID=5217 RepID=A0A4Q1BM03_TREME|nr:DNA repair protein rad18 [Tremella mesenterica]
MDLNHPLLASAVDLLPPFPSSHPQIQRLDRSLYCQICKELFSGPVSIPCGHSFCSRCIRGSLEVMKKCPSCNEPASEGSIRRNRALEEIVDSWEEARPIIHGLTSNNSRKRSIMNTGPKNAFAAESTKRPRKESTSRSVSPVKQSSDKKEEIDGDADDMIALDPYTNMAESSEDVKASCPLCDITMPIRDISRHIDLGCQPIKPRPKSQGRENLKADWKKVFSGAGLVKGKDVELKKITKPNYSLATPAELRSVLQSYNLSTFGDKPALAHRVQEWILLYNSNLDTSHPKSLGALRAKLNEAEASRRRDKEKGREEMASELKTSDGLARYAQDTKGEFERLRREIMERDKKRVGSGAEAPIEIE